MDLLHHPGADDNGACVDGGREPVQLVLQEREALGHTDEQDVDTVRRRLAGGQQAHGFGVGAVALQVRRRRPLREVGVGDLCGAVLGQRRTQRAPAVTDDHEASGERERLGPVDPLQVPQQVFVGRVPGLERVAGVLGESGEVVTGP